MWELTKKGKTKEKLHSLWNHETLSPHIAVVSISYKCCTLGVQRHESKVPEHTTLGVSQIKRMKKKNFFATKKESSSRLVFMSFDVIGP